MASVAGITPGKGGALYLSGKPRPLGRGKRFAVTSVVAALAILLSVRIAASGAIDWPIVGSFMLHPAILDGLLMTLELTALAMIVGVLLGILLAVMAVSRYPAVQAASHLYVWVFRGTPLLVQLIFWFNIALVFPVVGIGPWQIPINTLVTPFAAALLGLGLNEAAYMAEIVRAGISSVDKGQSEAGISVGMSEGQVMRHVVLPQAFRRMLPPLGNNAISLLKDSSLISAIGLAELAYAARTVAGAYSRYWEPYLTISLLYWILTLGLAYAVKTLELRHGRGDSR